VLLATLSLVAGTATITAGMIADNRVIVDTVASGSITTAKLADGAVTSAKITDGAVETADLANAAVTTAKIADSNVTTAKIADSNVTTAKIADGAVTLAKLSTALQSTIDAIDPPDAVIAIAGATAPTGWALCDGAAYSRTLYPATFARIGIVYGAGNGSTTFNVPDLRNRFIAGKGTAAWSDTLNEANDASRKDAVAVTHTHTSADHSHNVSGNTSMDGSHSHAGNGNGFVYWSTVYGSGAAAWPESGSVWALSWQTHTQSAGSHNHSWSGTSGGANSGAGNTTNSHTPSATGVDANLPPYRTLNYAIRLR
jgi:microcystin-dependent protein